MSKGKSRIRVKSTRGSRKGGDPYRPIIKNQLATIDTNNTKAFNRWLDTVKSSKNSHQKDLPSSQVTPIMAHINPDMQQLFVVLDTCSMVRYTHQFMGFVTNFKSLYMNTNKTPIKFIISLTVLEELDKCNRPKQKNSQRQKGKQPQQEDVKPSHLVGQKQTDHPPVDDIINGKEPPRLFMRFIEEEMRVGEILIGELDPYKTIKLNAPFEIINKDDRILECCLRSVAYIHSRPHFEGTRLILVSEDNIFKAKASTFGVASFRWLEFEAKYRNFGQKNCVPTPVCPSELVQPNKRTPATYSLIEAMSLAQIDDKQRLDTQASKISPPSFVTLKTLQKSLELDKNVPDPSTSKRRIALNTSTISKGSSRLLVQTSARSRSEAKKDMLRKYLESTGTISPSERMNLEANDDQPKDIAIVKEVINLF